jgi:uncharacterized Zn finger protein (UPF0148 family)
VDERRDKCPECGHTRLELLVHPGQFYCQICGVAGPGAGSSADRIDADIAEIQAELRRLGANDAVRNRRRLFQLVESPPDSTAG